MASEPCDAPFKGVLLAVAEVRIPLRQLTKKELRRVSHICYQKLLEFEVADATVEEKNLKCFGVVDSFYALQEVSIEIEGDVCRMSNRSEVVLELELSHLIIAMPALDAPDRLIIISRTQNFGRTAVILQMRSEQVVKQILKAYLNNQNVQSCEIEEDESSGFKRGAAYNSFGKAKRKVTRMLNALSGHDSGIDKATLMTLTVPSTPTVGSSTPSSLSENDDEDSADVDDDAVDTEDKKVPLNRLVFIEPRDESLNLEKVTMTPLEAELRYFKNSEESFVHILQYVEDVKKATVGNASALDVKEDHLLELFLHVDILLTLHKDFLNDLQASGTTVKEILQIFSNYFKRFEFYVDYIGHVLAVDYLFNLHSGVFNANYPQIGEYLRKPRMRLNHYVLVLESLKRSASEMEKGLLQKEIDNLKMILKSGNTKLIVASIRHCHFDLMAHGHVSLHGELILKRGVNLPRGKFQVFLFEDLLLLAKGSSDSCEYVASLLIKNMEILFRQRGVLIHLCTDCRDKKVKLSFKAKSVKLQQKWLEAIQAQIDVVNFIDRINNEVDASSTQNRTSSLGELLGIPAPEAPRRGSVTNDLATGRLPPLTLYNALPNLPCSSSFVQSTDWVFRQLFESEKTIVRVLRNLLCRHIQGEALTRSFGGIHAELQEMYHLHSDYLLPVIASSNTKVKPNFICLRVLAKMEDFQRLYEKVLFTAVAWHHEFPNNEINGTLKCIVDNYYVYVKTFYNIHVTMQIEICKKIIAMMNEIEDNVSASLKRKYIRQFPSVASPTSILYEGTLRRISGLSEQELYLILSETELSVVAICDGPCYVFEQSVQPQHLKATSLGTKLFEVKFISSGIDKVKYRLATSNDAERNSWIEAFRSFSLVQKKRKVTSTNKTRPSSIGGATSNIFLTISSPMSIGTSSSCSSFNELPVSEL